MAELADSLRSLDGQSFAKSFLGLKGEILITRRRASFVTSVENFANGKMFDLKNDPTKCLRAGQDRCSRSAIWITAEPAVSQSGAISGRGWA